MTDTRPQLIGQASANLDPDAPGFWTAGLFRLPESAGYILAGSGGPESDFAPETEEEKGRVIEMTETEAFNWAASHLTIDTVEEYFDHLIEEI